MVDSVRDMEGKVSLYPFSNIDGEKQIFRAGNTKTLRRENLPETPHPLSPTENLKSACKSKRQTRSRPQITELLPARSSMDCCYREKVAGS